VIVQKIMKKKLKLCPIITYHFQFLLFSVLVWLTQKIQTWFVDDVHADLLRLQKNHLADKLSSIIKFEIQIRK
jgi:hypothetical protein